MKDSLVTFNIVNENILLQNDPFPILFYWNGENSIEEDMKSSDDFYALLQNKCFNTSDYTRANVSYFYFEYDEDTNEEKYVDKKVNIQNFYLFKDMKEQDASFYIGYLFKYMQKLYSNAFKQAYDSKNLERKDAIKDMFNQIQELHPDRFSIESLCNYIRLQLQKHEQMLAENIEYVLANLTTILTSIKL